MQMLRINQQHSSAHQDTKNKPAYSCPPIPGEVLIYRKRSFPKAARMHKKREDNDPHRFFLSELMLFTGWEGEDELGSNDEIKCSTLYLAKQNHIQFVKRLEMLFAEGVEEARYYVQNAMQNDEERGDNRKELDPKQEQEILNCHDDEEVLHPDYIQLNPDELICDTRLRLEKNILTLRVRNFVCSFIMHKVEWETEISVYFCT